MGDMGIMNIIDTQLNDHLALTKGFLKNDIFQVFGMCKVYFEGAKAYIVLPNPLLKSFDL